MNRQQRRKRQLRNRIMKIGIILCMMAVLFLVVRACSNRTSSSADGDAARETYTFQDVSGQEHTATLLSDVPKQTYDLTRLTKKDGFFYYKNEAGDVTSKVGIDVSRHQGTIDWQKVKAQGVDYAMIRLGYRGYTEGTLKLDSKYEENIKGATDAGLDVGVYFFSQAISKKEAVEEAEFVLDHVKDYKLAYPVVFDTEKQEAEGARTEHTDGKTFTDCCIAFCDRIEKADYDSMIYYNMSWAAYTLDLTRLTSYSKWYADYCDLPQSPYAYDMWQYTESASLDGIAGNVDLNIQFQ